MNRVYFPSISENLVRILEKNPKEYYEKLCELKDKYDMDIIKKIVDCQHYECYMGHHLHALVYIVGDLYYEDSKQKIFMEQKLRSLKTLGLKF